MKAWKREGKNRPNVEKIRKTPREGREKEHEPTKGPFISSLRLVGSLCFSLLAGGRPSDSGSLFSFPGFFMRFLVKDLFFYINPLMTSLEEVFII